ncbi:MULTISPECIES: hypothetical protein [unclassified Dietzia]|uniref:hypothetical protein n=1 Tax=unclassified Dietzia TaxID=2617939 RepID=UPI000D2014B1|nr:MULTISPECIES: hypothetical protein [unclassified Dietzia]AVZ40406.1 hypothetical protein CT688_13940 [Dietzia sp. JS16-p6b]MBB1026268.1 hypothetical protein [Dietzia sp. DQ11-38-2]QGW25907.1 hypothetical protein GJR88_04426 [Dietzia sp. DQ12-45-1b]
MTYVIVVTPADPACRDAAHLDDLPAHVRADLLELRDQVSTRFPEADAVGETGALTRRPHIDGVGVVIHPGVITRPLVVNAVMRYAAPHQLLVTTPELGLVADPRVRIDIDVHRRPTTAGAGITDHAVRGRPHGTLPWVTHELLEQLVRALEVEGDRLELDVDEDRWFRYERAGDALRIQVADGPGVPLVGRTLELGEVEAAASTGWAWARGDRSWLGEVPGAPMAEEVTAA